VACVAVQSFLGPAHWASAAEIVDPIGVWNCLLYGHPRLGNERMLLRFELDGTTDVARPRDDEFRIWAPISQWTERRNRLFFEDSRSDRAFEGDLRASTLGGTWKDPSSHGGWWCSLISDVIAVDSGNVQRLSSNDLMPPLVSHLMATPNYPIQAIREAKEGHAVICFLVDASGSIVEPGVVEISDEIFRQPTLRAITSSSYRGWRGGPDLRPGCRTFTYELDAIY